MKASQTPLMPSPRYLPRNLNALHRYRARIADEIAKTREQIAVVKAHVRELKRIKADLAAIDRTLALHDIPVDPEDIRPVHNKYKRIDLPYGELSRCIYKTLRQSSPASHTAIFEAVAARHPHLVTDAGSIRQLKRSIHDRLKALASENRVKRHHAGVGARCGIWSFPDEVSDA